MPSRIDYHFERLQDGQLRAYADTTHHYRLTITYRHDPYILGRPTPKSWEEIKPEPWDICAHENWKDGAPVEPKGGWQNDEKVRETLRFFGHWSDTRDPWETKLDWIRKISPGVFEWHTHEMFND